MTGLNDFCKKGTITHNLKQTQTFCIFKVDTAPLQAQRLVKGVQRKGTAEVEPGP